MTEEDLDTCLRTLSSTIVASPYGEHGVSLNHGLHFTGGEPFLKPDLLLTAVKMAELYGIPSTFVETNCYWCRNDEVTEDMLIRLKAAGLKGILISVNPFYAEFVPFEKTERCIKISHQVFGSNVMVYQLEYYRRFKELGIKSTLPLDDYLSMVGSDHFTGSVELFLMGRAVRTLRELYPSHPAERFYHHPCLPPFLRDWHNHFDNYGHVMPGYCGGISLGSWRQLGELLEVGIDLEHHPVLNYLIAGDMAGLHRFAIKLGYPSRVDGYLSKCDLCLDIRHFLVNETEIEELSPRSFYTHLERG
jgi:hypothetical protein